MKKSSSSVTNIIKVLQLLLFTSVFLFLNSHVSPVESLVENVIGGVTIETNPDYVIPNKTLRNKRNKGDINGNNENNNDDDDDDDFSDWSSSSDDDLSDSSNDYSDDDDSDDVDSEEEGEDSKTIVNQALSITSKKATKSIQFLKKNRTSITIAFALFAFRREITNFILHFTTTTSKDGERKMKRISMIRISPTSILKIVLFIDFMRKIQDAGSGGGRSGGGMGIGSDGNMTGGRRGGGGGIIGHLMKEFLHSNTAFLPPVEQHYTFEKINDRFTKDENAWRKAEGGMSTIKSSPITAVREKAVSTVSSKLSTSSFFNRTASTISTNETSTNNDDLKEQQVQTQNNTTQTTIVLEMKVDTNVNTMSVIRDQISFIIHQHRSKKADISVTQVSNTTNTTLPITPQLEVIILLESPGGSATDYGLASNQITRLRQEPGIKVTICVDKVAASGGYMMACMASPGQLFAAPFSMIGSIGVYGQTLNIHDTLQNWGVKPLVFRGGKDKAPVGLVGEITKEGIAKVQSMIDKTHQAFKRHVVGARPKLEKNIDSIATGDVWLGHDALEIGLVDRIVTSDEYIWDKIHEGNQVLKLIKFQRPRLGLFGGPRYGPGFSVGMIHSSFQKVSDVLNDFKTTFRKINQILEDIPTQSNDISKVVYANAAYGPQMKIKH